MRSNTEEILKTLKEIRDEEYPEIKDDILEKLVDIQMQYQDDPSYRESETIKAITSLITELEGKNAF